MLILTRDGCTTVDAVACEPVVVSARHEAADQDVPDVVGPHLSVLFCGINPGLMSGSLGQHFARPGNRFWRVLHEAGFTDRLLAPAEQHLLPGYGLGVTNLVDRTTRAATDVSRAELADGARRLAAKVEVWSPRWVAVLGVIAYRRAFGRPKATVGRQPENIGPSGIWVLPNPSGLQARYQLADMVEMFGELRDAWGASALARGNEGSPQDADGTPPTRPSRTTRPGA